MRYFLAATTLMFSGFGFGFAHAQDDVILNPTGLIPNMNLATLEPFLEEVGLPVSHEDYAGQAAIVVTYGTQTAYLLPQACTDGVCDGLLMIAEVAQLQPATQEQVSRFNVDLYAASAVLSDGTLYVKNYVIADYGVTRGSFLIDLVVFFSMIDNWHKSHPSEN